MDLARLSRLLWDVDPADVDPERHDAFLVGRAFEEGTLGEIREVLDAYGADRIAKIERDGRLRSLSPKARAYLRVVTA